uniref:Uncharacterized protein n=1 Tax=Daphnia galeata TaxID=27404 RepID=A0A8J2R988_9CRUS|nr:unnamed protein product [Daphnia galeata]
MAKFHELEISEDEHEPRVGSNTESLIHLTKADQVKEDTNQVEVAAQSKTKMIIKSVISNIPDVPTVKVKRGRRLFLAPPVEMDQVNGVKVEEVKAIEEPEAELGDINIPTVKPKRFFPAPPLTMSLRERKAPIVLPHVNEPSPLRKKKRKSSKKKTSPPREKSFVDDYKPRGYARATKSEVQFIMSLRKRKAVKIFDYSSDEEIEEPIVSSKSNFLKSPPKRSKPAVLETNKPELSEYELEIKKKIEERNNIFKMLHIGDAKENLALALKK